ncbi:MAG: hypothetical protein RLY17_948 [Pseudomonadota bacterium]
MKYLDIRPSEVAVHDDLRVVDEEIIYDDLCVAVYEDETGMSVVNFNSQSSLNRFVHHDNFLIIERSTLPDQKYQAAWEFNDNRRGIVVNPEKLKALLVSEAERTRDYKLSLVREEMADLRSDLILDIITDADREKLVAIKKYITDLKNLDLSTAPDIEWPVAPV